MSTEPTPVSDSPLPAQAPLALRPKAAATAIGISLRLLSTLTREKRIPFLRINRAVVYPVAELQRWLAQKTAEEGRHEQP